MSKYEMVKGFMEFLEEKGFFDNDELEGEVVSYYPEREEGWLE
jgi:hypothetical protein